MSLGDFDTSSVVYFKFTTIRPSTGAPYTLAGTPALSVYKDSSTTQTTTGVTLTVDFDSVTGLNHVAIDTSADGTFYAAGSFFDVVITTGTVDSVSAVGAVVGRFTLRKQIVASVYGSVGSVTGAVGSVTGAVGSVTGNVGGNVSGNVSGNVVGSVGSVTGAVGSVTGAVGSVTGNVGGSVASVTGAVGSVTGNVGGDVAGKVLGGGSGTITGDGVRAASVTGAVGSVTGAVGSVVGLDAQLALLATSSALASVATSIAALPSAAEISDATWDDLDAHTTAGTPGGQLNTIYTEIQKVPRVGHTHRHTQVAKNSGAKSSDTAISEAT